MSASCSSRIRRSSATRVGSRSARFVRSPGSLPPVASTSRSCVAGWACRSARARSRIGGTLPARSRLPEGIAITGPIAPDNSPLVRGGRARAPGHEPSSRRRPRGVVWSVRVGSALLAGRPRRLRHLWRAGPAARESISACWTCYECHADHLNECRRADLLGLTVNGALAPLVRVDARHCYRIAALVRRYGRNAALELGTLLEPLGGAHRGLLRAGVVPEDRLRSSGPDRSGSGSSCSPGPQASGASSRSIGSTRGWRWPRRPAPAPSS